MAITLKKAFEDQVNREFYSAYLYLDLATQMKDLGLDGIANWMRVQAQEEKAHATHMYDYAVDRWSGVKLPAIAQPDVLCKTPVEAFAATLEHEKYITRNINEQATLAMQENDHAAYAFLTWYVNEQVEEESNASTILLRLQLIGGDTSMLLNVDDQLATRVFVDPFPGAGA